jgi:anti-sigma factor RsiW
MILHKLKIMLGLEPSCEKVNGFIVQYLEGDLDEKTRKKFAAHIGDCSTCGRFFEQYKATIDLTRAAGDITPPQELVEKTLAFLRTRWASSASASD